MRRNIQTHIKTKEKKLVEKMTAYNDIQLTIVHTVCVSILFYFFIKASHLTIKLCIIYLLFFSLFD